MYFESNHRPLPGWGRYMAMASNDRVYIFNSQPQLRQIDGQTLWRHCANHQPAHITARMMDVTHLLSDDDLKKFQCLAPSQSLTIVCPYDEDMNTAIELAQGPGEQD